MNDTNAPLDLDTLRRVRHALVGERLEQVVDGQAIAAQVIDLLLDAVRWRDAEIAELRADLAERDKHVEHLDGEVARLRGVDAEREAMVARIGRECSDAVEGYKAGCKAEIERLRAALRGEASD